MFKFQNSLAYTINKEGMNKLCTPDGAKQSRTVYLLFPYQPSNVVITPKLCTS